MVEILEHSNILEVKSGIICNQVNCMGAMGAGLALQIKNKWPIVFKQYKEECNLFHEDPTKLLGKVHDTVISQNLVVANCFGQVFPSRNGMITDYHAWDEILDKLNDLRNFFSLDLHFPYMVGCGLAGGNWNVIFGKIMDKFGRSSTPVCIHQL
jgi:hypothetical protein